MNKILLYTSEKRDVKSIFNKYFKNTYRKGRTSVIYFVYYTKDSNMKASTGQ
jgi:hypothetical protein